MRIQHFAHLGAAAFLAILSVFCVKPTISSKETDAVKTDVNEKELYLPEKATRVPDDNDYENPESDFSFARMVEGDDVVVFWHKEYGENPMENPDETRRFDVDHMLSECERFFDYYVDELKLVRRGSSVCDDKKLLVYVYGGDGGTAFGGGVDNKIGALWTPAVRVNKTPYGVLAHELGHSFQFMSRIDSGAGAPGAINEMAAQYVLWQVYPEWMTFENYHLVDFMKQTHYAFLHPINMYHSPYVLEYWSNKRGREFYADLCRDTRQGEDPVATYKRMNDLTQEQFNDEMFDAARRFITWDMPRIEEVARPYADQHFTILHEADEGWLRIAPEKCPQNYGYNGVRLRVPEGGGEVRVQFQGLAGAEGYNAVKTGQAGWRYGFLAHLQDNRRVYGDVGKDAEGALTFDVPEDAETLWLVVMGAPEEHWPVAGRRRGRDAESAPEEQWPYQIKLSGTALHEAYDMPVEPAESE